MTKTMEAAAGALTWQGNAPAPVQQAATTTSERSHGSTLSYTEIFGSEHIAAPVEAALARWRAAAAAPRIAAIGNGLFVRVGTGKKRRNW